MINFLKSLFIVIISNIFITELSAQSRPKISIQGTLKDAKGAAVSDGDQSVVFKLWDAPTNGNQLWTETATVKVVGGIYSHYLGSVDSLNASIFNKTLYLGVSVGGFQLDPRIEMTYAPYAFAVQEVVCSGAVGDVKYSILNPTQFATVNGSCWVPMDGIKTLSGTKLGAILTGMTNVPNGGGLFVRAQEFSGGANHDPDRDHNSPIATFEDQALQTHQHGFSGNTDTKGNHRHNITLDVKGSDGGNGTQFARDGTGSDNNETYTDHQGDHSHSFSGTTGDNSGFKGQETRPKNMNFWVYIRVN